MEIIEIEVIARCQNCQKPFRATCNVTTELINDPLALGVFIASAVSVVQKQAAKCPECCGQQSLPGVE